MISTRISSKVLQDLNAKLRAMTESMLAGNKLAVARFYSDDALLTDLKDFRVEGREAIDRHWTQLPTYQSWQLNILETGGDLETPFQRLHSLAHMEIKGREYIDEGYCFVVWKRQANGDYQIHADIYRPLKFEVQGG